MIEIGLAKHEADKDRLMDLFRKSFGSNMSAELWEWKYLQNPSGQSEVVVATDNGNIVGARPFLYCDMWLADKRIKTAQHCDTMVHPDYQNQGIFNRMGQFAIQHLRETGHTLSYGFPALTSQRGFAHQGYTKVVDTEILFRMLQPGRLFTRRMRSKLLGEALGFLYDKLINTRTGKTTEASDSFQIETHDRFIGELQHLDTLRDKRKIDLVRDERYLRWRFDQHPEQSYKYVLVKNNGHLCGYAVVVTQRRRSGLVFGTIVDYLVSDGDINCFRALTGECMKQLTNMGSDIVHIWAFSEPDFRKELLQHFGFKSTLNFPYSRYVLCGYMDALLLDNKTDPEIDIYDKSNWRVTYALPDTR